MGKNQPSDHESLYWQYMSRPDGTGSPSATFQSKAAEHALQEKFARGLETWADLIEAQALLILATTDRSKLANLLAGMSGYCETWIAVIEERNRAN